MIIFGNMKQVNRTWSIIFLMYFAVILTIIILAYLSLLPFDSYERYYIDKIMHFILLGFLGYLLHRSLNRKWFYFIPIGPFLVIIFCIIDEGIQHMSPIRTSDWYDFYADLSGIFFFFATDSIVVYLKNIRKKVEKNKTL